MGDFLAKIQRWIGMLFVSFAIFCEAFGPLVEKTSLGFLVPYTDILAIIGFFIIFYSFLKVYRPLLWTYYIIFTGFLLWYYFIK